MNGMGILEFDLEVEVLSRDNRVGLGRNNPWKCVCNLYKWLYEWVWEVKLE